MPFTGYQATSIIRKAKRAQTIIHINALFQSISKHLCQFTSLVSQPAVPEEWLHITNFSSSFSEQTKSSEIVIEGKYKYRSRIVTS